MPILLNFFASKQKGQNLPFATEQRLPPYGANSSAAAWRMATNAHDFNAFSVIKQHSARADCLPDLSRHFTFIYCQGILPC